CAEEWVRGMLRYKGEIDLLGAGSIYPMGGDAKARETALNHNADPDANDRIGICFLDGDSPLEADGNVIYKLPGTACTEEVLVHGVIDQFDECLGYLTAALGLDFYAHQDRVRETVMHVIRTNRDPHMLFNQVGERLGL